MKFVPVDTTRVECVYVETVGKMVDGAQKVARDDGRPIWAVRCLLRDLTPVPGGAPSKPELVEVAIPNPRDLGEVLDAFQPIQFDNLRCFPWVMEGRNGLAFSADGCRTGKASRNGSKGPTADVAGG